MTEWPLDLWLKLAVCSFGLSPTEFWAMSVRDWLALQAGDETLGLARPALGKLMHNYPDQVQKGEKQND